MISQFSQDPQQGLEMTRLRELTVNSPLLHPDSDSGTDDSDDEEPVDHNKTSSVLQRLRARMLPVPLTSVGHGSRNNYLPIPDDSDDEIEYGDFVDGMSTDVTCFNFPTDHLETAYNYYPGGWSTTILSYLAGETTLSLVDAIAGVKSGMPLRFQQPWIPSNHVAIVAAPIVAACRAASSNPPVVVSNHTTTAWQRCKNVVSAFTHTLLLRPIPLPSSLPVVLKRNSATRCAERELVYMTWTSEYDRTTTYMEERAQQNPEHLYLFEYLVKMEITKLSLSEVRKGLLDRLNREVTTSGAPTKIVKTSFSDSVRTVSKGGKTDSSRLNEIEEVTTKGTGKEDTTPEEENPEQKAPKSKGTKKQGRARLVAAAVEQEKDDADLDVGYEGEPKKAKPKTQSKHKTTDTNRTGSSNEGEHRDLETKRTEHVQKLDVLQVSIDLRKFLTPTEGLGLGMVAPMCKGFPDWSSLGE